MADIPQEVREAAEKVFIEAQRAYNTAFVLEEDGDPIEAGLMAAASVLAQHDSATFLAGKRAGMERAAQIADRYNLAETAAYEIRSENDGHG